MSIEENLDAMEARIAELEQELAELHALNALNADGIEANKQQIHKNRMRVEEQANSLKSLMAGQMTASQMTETSYIEQPELTPIENLTMTSYINAPAAIRNDIEAMMAANL